MVMTDPQKKWQINFKRNNWILLSLIVPITGLGILFLSLFTIPLIISINGGLSLNTYEIWGALLVNIIVLGLVFFAWVVGITGSSIEFTDLGITKRGVVGSTTIKWSEIVTVYTLGMRIFIKTHDKKIEINMIYYRNPEELVRLIRENYKSETREGNPS
jgi:hypothetical protein